MPALSAIVDSHYVKALICAADGCLFPSEPPARRARARVANAFLASFGVQARYDDHTVPPSAPGTSFRATALALASANGIPVSRELGEGAGAPSGAVRVEQQQLDAETLRRWEELEEVAVADYLGCCLRPDRSVLDALGRLSVDYSLAALAHWGPSRLDVCLAATHLDGLIPTERRLCLPVGEDEDSVEPEAVAYKDLCVRLGLRPEDVVAVEHTRAGVRAATVAGVRTIGNLHYVTARERGMHAVELARAGALVVVRNWSTIARLLRCLP